MLPKALFQPFKALNSRYYAVYKMKRGFDVSCFLQDDQKVALMGKITSEIMEIAQSRPENQSSKGKNKLISVPLADYPAVLDKIRSEQPLTKVLQVPEWLISLAQGPLSPKSLKFRHARRDIILPILRNRLKSPKIPASRRSQSPSVQLPARSFRLWNRPKWSHNPS